MVEILLISFGIALALSVDAFIACFAYGTNQVRASRSTIYTPILIGVFHFVFPFITFTFCKLFTNEFEKTGNIIGGILFLILGAISLFKKEEKQCRILDVIGVILLTVGVSIDSLLVGVSLSFSLKSIILPGIIFALVSAIASILSIRLSKRLCHLQFNCEALSGIFFIFLGIITFFDWL